MDPHVTDWLTKPSQVLWTGNQPIYQVVYFSVFCLHTLLRPSKVWLFFIRLNMSRCTKKVKWLRRSTLTNFLKSDLLTMHPLSPGGLSVLPNFQKRGPGRISIFRGRLLEKRGWLFWAGGRRDHSCCIKNKLKSEIWNNQKK